MTSAYFAFHRIAVFPGVDCFSRLCSRTLPVLRSIAAVAFLIGLTGCASTVTTRVTNFNQWPANAAGNIFSFVTRTGPGELEQATYQTYVQTELERIGLKRAAGAQPGRFQVELTTGNRSEEKTSFAPVYQDTPVFLPPYRDAVGRYYPGIWTYDPFGPRYVGDRAIRTVIQVTTLNVRILDSEGAPAGKSRAVFESRAGYEGQGTGENLPQVVPYLVRAVFADFPGQNGKTRLVRFDAKTGALIRE
jgi:hypothetical protein